MTSDCLASYEVGKDSDLCKNEKKIKKFNNLNKLYEKNIDKSIQIDPYLGPFKFSIVSRFYKN